MRVVAWVFAGITLVGVVARLVPAAASDLPYLPVIVALTPWFAATAVVALVLSHALGAGARIAVRRTGLRPSAGLRHHASRHDLQRL